MVSTQVTSMAGGKNGAHVITPPGPSKAIMAVKTSDDLYKLLEARRRDVHAGTQHANFTDRVSECEEGENGQDDAKSLDIDRSSYRERVIMREKLSLSLLMSLNSAQMASIKLRFHEANDEIDLEDFVCIMEAHLPTNISMIKGPGGVGTLYDGNSNPSSKDVYGATRQVVPRSEIVSNLVELFREVDINGDGIMEWDEFTRFIVEKAQIYHKKMSIDQHFPEYRQSSRHIEMVSSNRNSEGVDSFCFVPRSQALCVIQEYNPVVNIYNAVNWKIMAKLELNAAPLAMAYEETNHTMLTCGADMTMTRWNLDDVPQIRQYTQLSKWPTRQPQMSVCWSPSDNMLYSGSASGDIHGWNIDERTEVVTLKGHTDIVMYMIVMDRLNNLVSASLDKGIRVWDTYTERPLHTLTSHSKGVFALSYSSEYRCLVSAGFDHEAYVWSPFVNSLLYKLKGHDHSLVGCQTVPGTPELITADASGVIKIWDVRTFQCVQTVQYEQEEDDLLGKDITTSCFIHCRLPPTRFEQEEDNFRVITARGRKLYHFDQLRHQNDPITDKFPISAAVFNSISLTILTATERTVKIWDALTGTLKMVYLDLTPGDITAVCLDDRQRKFVLGDAKGYVAVFNYRNGAKMKKLGGRHSSPVVDVQYCNEEKAVVVICRDGEIICYDEMNAEFAPVLHTFQEGNNKTVIRDDISCLAMSYNSEALAAASRSSDEGVAVWNLATGRVQMVIQGDSLLANRHVQQHRHLLQPGVNNTLSNGNILTTTTNRSRGGGGGGGDGGSGGSNRPSFVQDTSTTATMQNTAANRTHDAGSGHSNNSNNNNNNNSSSVYNQMTSRPAMLRDVKNVLEEEQMCEGGFTTDNRAHDARVIPPRTDAPAEQQTSSLTGTTTATTTTEFTCTCILFLDPYRLLLVCCSDGVLRMFSIEEKSFPGVCVLKWTNRPPPIASFWGEQQREYPLLRPKGTVDKLKAALAAEVAVAAAAAAAARSSRTSTSIPQSLTTATTSSGAAAGAGGGPAESDDDSVNDSDEGRGGDGGGGGGGSRSTKKSGAGTLTGIAAGEGNGEGQVAVNNVKRNGHSNNHSNNSGTALGGEGEYDIGLPIEEDFSKWKRFPQTPAHDSKPLAVLSAIWCAAKKILVTGDEGGHLRGWSLAKVFAKLPMHPVTPPVPGSVLRNTAGKTVGDESQWRRTSVTAFRPGELDEWAVDFVWGIENAHEDAVFLLREAGKEPYSILSASTDRCVKAWTMDGRFQGVLLQALRANAPNPRWNFHVDVLKREETERAQCAIVMDKVERRQRGIQAGREDSSDQNECVNVRTSPMRAMRQTQGPHNNTARRRRRQSAMKRLGLANVGSTANTAGGGGGKSLDNNGLPPIPQTQQRGKADRFANSVPSSPPHKDSASSPMEGLQHQQLLQSISIPNIQWAAKATTTAAAKPSVVPPSPGRATDVSTETQLKLSATIDRLSKFLDEAEEKEAHQLGVSGHGGAGSIGGFGGVIASKMTAWPRSKNTRIGVHDFVKGLVDPAAGGQSNGGRRGRVNDSGIGGGGGGGNDWDNLDTAGNMRSSR